jgi:prephenate dehydratase
MRIAFQGALGAYSDMACRQIFDGHKTVPCKTFEGAFTAVRAGHVDRAVIPIDNTLAGRVADVHHLLPKSDLFIVGEHFVTIRHCLLGFKNTVFNELKRVHSHVHAIPQCREFFREHPEIEAVVHADTAGAAMDISKWNDKSQGAIASELAADIYDLDILKRDLQDEDTNTTRFIVLSPDPIEISPDLSNVMTSFVFQVRNIPAALYKAMGGFATNGVNMMKMESYVDDKFQAARFYCEIDGHASHDNVKLALDELSFFAKDIKILGSYQKSDFRKALGQS